MQSDNVEMVEVNSSLSALLGITNMETSLQAIKIVRQLSVAISIGIQLSKAATNPRKNLATLCH